MYVYSPNGPLTSEEEYMDRYPGDDCVDIVAFDYYDDYNTYPAEYSGEFVDNLKKNLSGGKEYCRRKRKSSCNFRNRCKGDESRWIG
ncbi:MAG: glycosyl hydrolase [Mediterraneibacter gnavus]